MKKIFLFVLLAGTLLFAQNKKASKIVVTPGEFDFGKIVEGTVVTKDFEIKNAGNDTLIIKRVRASCGCTAASPDKDILLPGEKTTLKVSFNSANRSGKQKKHIYVFSNDPMFGEFRFTFYADIVSDNKDESILLNKPQLKLERNSYDFGKAFEGEKLKLSLSFKNTGKDVLEIKDVKTSCGCTVASLSSKKLIPGQNGKLDIEFDTSDRQGKMARTITLFSNDPKDPEQTITLFVNILERNS